MLCIRINTLLRGHSGIRVQTLREMAAMLNAGIVPVVPQLGSVGASGDLAPLSHLAIVLLGGGEGDEARLAKLGSALPGEQLDLAQNLPLTELAHRLHEATVFLGHDSGISHLAAAVGTPALLLFGPTDPAIWAPPNPQVRVLRSPSLTLAGIGVDAVSYELMDIGIRT